MSYTYDRTLQGADIDEAESRVREALAEDQDDLAAFEDRVAEPTLSYEAFLNELKADGKL